MVLNPIDRLTEVLYGIIMVLTFTGTLRVAAQGGEAPGTTLWGAVGCSLAWGLVDGTMFARYTGTSPLWDGLRFMAAGAALVATTIALGG